ncbi:MAG: ThuA domain-containing protein [Pseudomonadales bacterium]|nr:ThuA domain-containing protein [Pseudomonadales bacterium]
MTISMLKAGTAATLMTLTMVLMIPPALAQQSDLPRLLFLTYAGLYAHPSLADAERVVTQLGQTGGFEVTTNQGYAVARDAMDLSYITREYLNQFDALMLFTNGNLPMADSQKQAILDFVTAGGGLIGTHAAVLTFYDYAPFGEMLGGYFKGAVGQNRLVVLNVEDRDHPATRMLGPSWPVVDEFYRFGTAAWNPATPDANVDELFGLPIPVAFSRERVNVLLSINTALTNLEGLPLQADGDYPQAWWRNYGDGRVFYTAFGHEPDTWNYNKVFQAHLLGGIRWALGLEN